MVEQNRQEEKGTVHTPLYVTIQVLKYIVHSTCTVQSTVQYSEQYSAQYSAQYSVECSKQTVQLYSLQYNV